MNRSRLALVLDRAPNWVHVVAGIVVTLIGVLTSRADPGRALNPYPNPYGSCFMRLMRLPLVLGERG